MADKTDWSEFFSNKQKHKYRDIFGIKDEAAFLKNDMAANCLKRYDSKKRRRSPKRKRDDYARNRFSKHKGKRACKPVVVGKNGDPCPRCGCRTEIRQHKQIRAKHLRQPFYYSRWYYCVNPGCRTTQIMLEKFKVFPSVPHNVTDVARRLEALEKQLGQKFLGWFD